MQFIRPKEHGLFLRMDVKVREETRHTTTCLDSEQPLSQMSERDLVEGRSPVYTSPRKNRLSLFLFHQQV